MDEETPVLHLTREEILRDPDLLKSLYKVIEKEKLIDWILSKELTDHMIKNLDI